MSSSSDRSSNSTPSSESESIASNSTIISDQATQPATPHTHQSSQPTSRHGAGRSGNVSRTDASNSICSPALTSNNNGGNNGAFTVRLEHHGGNRWSSSVTGSSGLSGRKNHHSNNNIHNQYDSVTRQEHANDSSGNNKDQSYNNSNQRITRSSQRAAQQVKNELNQSDSNNGDDQHQLEGEKDSGRKVKRRKGETVQDVDQDNSQPPVVPQPPAMANICPADYQLPTQNSFQLYREIRNFSSRQLGKLDHVQPKAPQGFKEFLLNSCLYSLDNSKIAPSRSGEIIEPIIKRLPTQAPTNFKKTLAIRTSSSTETKLTSVKSQQSSNSRVPTLLDRKNLPKISAPPARLEKGSSLYELYQEHENSRQQMRIQHLKERERLILSAEQEVLRAYNRAAIAERGQEHPLSACTYLYYQEKYHYSDKTSDKKRQIKQGLDEEHQESQPQPDANPGNNIKESSLSDTDKTITPNVDTTKSPTTNKVTQQLAVKSEADDAVTVSTEMNDKCGPSDENIEKEPVEQEPSRLDESSCDDNLTISENDTNDNTGKLLIDELTSSDVDSGITKSDSNLAVKLESNTDGACQIPKGDIESGKKAVVDDDTNRNKTSTTSLDEQQSQSDIKEDNDTASPTNNDSSSNKDECKNDDTIIEGVISDEELKILNKETFLTQLQEIDEKWERIRNEMLQRHRNEADSLFAVQSMEWEWKTKELGLCDVRKTFKLESEFVPRIEIVSHDY